MVEDRKDIRVDVKGVPELRARLRALGVDRIPKRLARAAKEAAEVVAADARRRAPKRTGRLAARTRATATAKVGVVRSSVRYAAPIHWGTGSRAGLRGPHNIYPNPFLYDARDASRERVIQRYEDALSHIEDDL